MSEQQYRVIADRDKGDDPQNWDRVEEGDRVVVIHADGEFWPTRIERPVPATDRPDLTRDQFSNDESYYLATGRKPPLPTREQIAVSRTLLHAAEQSLRESGDVSLADAVLALLQKGADR